MYPDTFQEKEKKSIEWLNIFLKFLSGFIGSLIGTFTTFFLLLALVGKSSEKFLEAQEKNLSSNFNGGKFEYPTEPEKNNEWLKEKVFQEKVRKELKLRINCFKFLSNLQTGERAVSNHMLFCGPLGTGKSYLARELAKNESLAYGLFSLGNEIFRVSSQKKIDSILQEARKIDR